MKKGVFAFVLLLTSIGVAVFLSQKNDTPKEESKTIENKEVDKEKKVTTNSENIKEISEKLKNYDFIGDISNRIADSYNRYLSWVDWKTGPTGKEKYVYGLYDIYSIEYNLESLQKAIDGMNLPELDAKTKEYRDQLKATVNLIKEAYNYYNGEYYLDDNWKKGKSIHQPLLDSFIRYFDITAKLNELLFEHHKALRANAMERIKEDKFDLLVTKSYLLVDKALEIYQMAAKVNELKDFNLDSLTISIEEYEAQLNELKQYAEKNKEEQDKYTTYHLFLTEIDNYSKAIRGVKRRVIANEEYTDYERKSASWHTENTHWQIIAKFEDMVSRYNGIWNIPAEVFFFYNRKSRDLDVDPSTIKIDNI